MAATVGLLYAPAWSDRPLMKRRVGCGSLDVKCRRGRARERAPATPVDWAPIVSTTYIWHRTINCMAVDHLLSCGS